MNKTLAIMAVALSIMTAFFIIGLDTGVDGEDTIRIDGASYSIITDADTVSYTDDSLPSKRIYVDSPSVKAEAFKDCTRIQYVVFSDSVTSIGDRAFEGCNKLMYVKMTNVQTIGDYAFKGTTICNNMISSALTSIGKYAFSECSGMYSPILSGTGVTELKEGVFKNSDVKIEDLRNITKIAEDAFEGTSLKGQIVNEGQNVKIAGVPEITLGDFEFTNLDVTSSQGVLYLDFWVGPNIKLTRTDSTGSTDYESELFVFNTGDYACVVPYNEVNTHIEARTTTIHFQEYLGMGDIVHKSGDGKYVMPAPRIGGNMFISWSVEGIEGAVREMTEADFCSLGSVIEPIANFATRTITYDHSQITGTSGLPASATFTVGDRYAALDNVSGYEFSGWRVNGSFYAAGSLIDTYSDHTAVSVWDALTCKVEVMDTDGRVTSTINVEKGSSFDLSTLTYLEKDGEEFLGWSLSVNGSRLTSDPTVNSDIRLYPLIRDRQSFTVTFIDDGRILGTLHCYKGRQVTIDQDNPSKDGKIFENWVLRDTGTKYFKGDSLMLSKNIELEAVWKTITVRVYYHLDQIERCEYDWGTSVTIGSDSAVRKGYNLIGWSLNMNGPVDYLDGQTVRMTETIELYPCWTEIGKLKVTCHDYSGRLTVKEIDEGDTFTVPKPAARDEGVFLGWSLGMDRRVNYTPGDTFAVYDDVDLFEVWDASNSHTVTCHDHTGGSRTTTVEEGALFTVPRSSAREDASFLGWSTSTVGSEEYQPGDYFVVTSDIDLYEVWRTSSTYDVTMHDHTGRTTVSTVTKNGSFTVPRPAAREGWVFSGWAVTYSGSPIYMPGDSFRVSGDTDLYEIWTNNAQQVGYRTVTCYDYAGEATTSYVAEGGMFTVPKAKSDTVGTFLGWALSSNGTAQYTPGDSFRVTGDVVLYEVWNTVVEYSVTCHDHTGGTQTVKVVAGTLFAIPDAVPRDGFTFMGWATRAGGSASYLSGAQIVIASDMDLYQVWTQRQTFSVTVHDGNDSVYTGYSGESLDVTLPAMVRDGFDHIGWSTLYNSQTAQYTAPSVAKVTSGCSFYPVWKEKETVSVIVHRTGADTMTHSLYKGDALTLPASFGKESGKTHLGWTLSPDGTGRFFSVGSTIYPTESMELFTFWSEPDIVRITFMDDSMQISVVNVVTGTGYDLSRVDVPAKTGYDFIGWSTSQTSSRVSYEADDTLTVTDGMTLYAVWEKLLTVTYHVGDDTETVYCQAGSDVTLKTVTKDGYTFKGWSTTGTMPVLESTIMVYRSMDIFPVWEKTEQPPTPSIVIEPDDTNDDPTEGSSGGFLESNAMGIVAAAVAAALVVMLVIVRRS